MQYNTHTNVATIMADPAQMALNEQEVDSVVDALQASGGIIMGVEWLAENTACDVFFEVISSDEAYELLSHLLTHVPFDYIVQSAHGRKKKLLVADMDSTIIEQECIDELADFLGLKEKISEITQRAMNGELDFKEALRERVALLVGLEEERLKEAYDTRITFTPGGKEVMATMRANGARTVLVSGGFTFFTSRVKDVVGFDVEEANILELADRKLTGKVKEPILDKENKLNALRFHAEDLDIPIQATMAVGDGANDLPMLQAAGLGVAFHAHPNVRMQTKAQLNTCDLTALLYAQGYRETEIITSS